MSKNYISITAGADEQEVTSLVGIIHETGFSADSRHEPAIGFLVSQKSMLSPNDKMKNLRFPLFNELPSLLRIAESNARTIIHYNPDNNQPSIKQTRAEQVIQSLATVQQFDLCSAVQLNTKEWYSKTDVELIKQTYPSIDIILQVSEHMMNGMAPKTLANRINSYEDTIDYVLLDPSRGMGKEMDVQRAAKQYQAIKTLPHDYGVVFAGGLSPDNVATVVGSLKRMICTDDFSIDAEGKLRDKLRGEQYFGNDLLNLKKTKAYLENAKRAFDEN